MPLRMAIELYMMSVRVFMCAGENVTVQGVTIDLCP